MSMDTPEISTIEKIRDEEKLVPESNVRFPLEEMYEFARTIWEINNMTPRDQWDDYNIFSVQFHGLSSTGMSPRGMYAVSMHCQVRRFEEFVDRYGATITRVSELHGDLHVCATVKNDTLGWFEIRCIYEPRHLERCRGSIFEGADNIAALFRIYASVKDWSVDPDVWKEVF